MDEGKKRERKREKRKKLRKNCMKTMKAYCNARESAWICDQQMKQQIVLNEAGGCHVEHHSMLA